MMALDQSALPEVLEALKAAGSMTGFGRRDEVLHEKWRPGGAQTLESQIHWKGVGTGNETLDFAQADFRGSLARLAEETVEQVRSFITDAVP